MCDFLDLIFSWHISPWRGATWISLEKTNFTQIWLTSHLKAPIFHSLSFKLTFEQQASLKNAEDRQKGRANSVTLKVGRVWHGRTWTQWKIGGHCRQCTSLTHFYIIDPRLQLGVEAGRCPPFNFSPTWKEDKNLNFVRGWEEVPISGVQSHQHDFIYSRKLPHRQTTDKFSI